MQPSPIIQVLSKSAQNFYPVVPFKPGVDHLLKMDLTAGNKGLTEAVFKDTDRFSAFISEQLEKSGSRYGIGGYGEHRDIYSRSPHFDAKEEPRRFHLGVDIWGPAGTPVYAFMGGRVHSVAYNEGYGDYGATLILLHQLDAVMFYTLYGHLSMADIKKFTAGQYVIRGQEIAHFGTPGENGQWPPHLHMQIIGEMGIKEGDYPGVCKYSEREKYMKNCPDPDLILRMNQYL
jgi:murein DD-endopeptidase MepM/ murein hydrolase activator NlpD